MVLGRRLRGRQEPLNAKDAKDSQRAPRMDCRRYQWISVTARYLTRLQTGLKYRQIPAPPIRGPFRAGKSPDL